MKRNFRLRAKMVHIIPQTITYSLLCFLLQGGLQDDRRENILFLYLCSSVCLCARSFLNRKQKKIATVANLNFQNKISKHVQKCTWGFIFLSIQYSILNLSLKSRFQRIYCPGCLEILQDKSTLQGTQFNLLINRSHRADVTVLKRLYVLKP